MSLIFYQIMNCNYLLTVNIHMISEQAGCGGRACLLRSFILSNTLYYIEQFLLSLAYFICFYSAITSIDGSVMTISYTPTNSLSSSKPVT